MLTIVRK